VQEDRFLAAAVEHERIAPFQPHDNLPLACFFRHEVADGILVERLRRGRADVDALGGGSRHAQHALVDAMVVHDDISTFETLSPSYAHQCRVARPGADDVDAGRHL
jgi:hypothetical protein